MKVVKGATADRGLQAVLTELNKQGNYIETPSRNGPVRRFKGPATIMWVRPRYRVSFDPIRDANPAFHLFEALWMLGGHNDVERPKYFASQMGQFSDDGVVFNGAYGHRWVQHFGYDQLRHYVIPALRANRDDRRVVLQMWDGEWDSKMTGSSKDVPCNLGCTFDAAQQDGRLHLNVFNRSNDIVWGATGANVVQFSMLQEYVASACDLELGTYEQIATNSHIYLELNEVSKRMLASHAEDPMRDLPYLGKLSPLRDRTDGSAEAWQQKFDYDIGLLMENHTNVFDCDFSTRFFREVVKPVIMAFNCYKNQDDLEAGLFWLLEMLPRADSEQPWYRWNDWNIAMYQWLMRRCDMRNAKIKKILEAPNNEEFVKGVREVWKTVDLDGDRLVLTGTGVVKAELAPRRYIAYRGPTDANIIDGHRKVKEQP